MFNNNKTREKIIGVYKLSLKKKVIYVGQSVDVLLRIQRHRTEGLVFDDIDVILCSKQELDVLEIAIAKFYGLSRLTKQPFKQRALFSNKPPNKNLCPTCYPNCKECNELFERGHSKQRFCSDKCRILSWTRKKYNK